MPGEALAPRVLDTAAVAGSLDQLHELLEGLWCDAPGVGLRDRMAFTTAAAEVAANIVEHAARFAPVRLRLVLHLTPDRVEVLFEDRGAPYVPVERAGAEDLPESGRGLAMARALVDEVLYERDGPVNRWLVARRLAE